MQDCEIFEFQIVLFNFRNFCSYDFIINIMAINKFGRYLYAPLRALGRLGFRIFVLEAYIWSL